MCYRLCSTELCILRDNLPIIPYTEELTEEHPIRSNSVIVEHVINHHSRCLINYMYYLLIDFPDLISFINFEMIFAKFILYFPLLDIH